MENLIHMFHYVPNFEEVEGQIGLGLSVPLSTGITLCIRSRIVRDRVLKFSIWNKHEK